MQKIPDKDSVIVRYLITSRLEPKDAVEKLCREQSIGPVYGVPIEITTKFFAKYVPSSIKKVRKNQFSVDIIYPFHNTESSLSMVLSAAAGDAYNIAVLYPLKILSITLPQIILKRYGGPAYGVSGLRKLLHVYDRPLLLGPVKPCIGMNPDAFAKRAKEALLGGADIVKDDELICNPDYNPLAIRVKKMAKVVQDVQKATGERRMYFAFIGGGSPLEMLTLAKVAKENGADGFMVGPAINGFEIVKDLKEKFGLPIIAHNNYTYSAYTKHHGISFSVFALLQRVCGADIVITPGKYGTFDIMTREEQLENVQAVHSNISGIERAFPAFSGGQSPKTIPKLRHDVGNNDFIVTAGTSLYDHPDGPTAGARTLKESFLKLG